jgi:hypothetical protein
MVELAAVFPAAESAGLSPAPAEAASPGPPPGVKIVQMDNAVALFHAFDLATAPNEHDGGSGPVTGEASEMNLPPEPTPSASPSDAPAADTSASARRGPDGRPAHAASPLPAFAIASLLAAVDAVHLEEASEDRQRRGRSVRCGQVKAFKYPCK